MPLTMIALSKIDDTDAGADQSGAGRAGRHCAHSARAGIRHPGQGNGPLLSLASAMFVAEPPQGGPMTMAGDTSWTLTLGNSRSPYAD
jgi:hypothetical protein